MLESDLYEPIKGFLEKQGYGVKAEINGCDMVGKREDTVVVVELKLTANLKLLTQAVDRKSITDDVYVGVPSDCPVIRSDLRKFTKLLRMLGVGLLLVDLETSSVIPQLDPGVYRPTKHRAKRARLLKEYDELIGDPNIGGSSTRKGRMTVYRQKAIIIARHLEGNGPDKASRVRDALNIKKARNILYDNVYGWFDAHGKGIYGLSPRGKRELSDWQD